MKPKGPHPNVVEAARVLGGQLVLLPPPQPSAPPDAPRRSEPPPPEPTRRPRGPYPTHDAIAVAQVELTDLLGIPAEDAPCSCWACGASSLDFDGDEIRADRDDRGWLERGHIVAHSAGGSLDPSNFLLLCHTCHKEQPDAALLAEQVQWLRTHESQITRILRGVKPVFEAIRKVATLHGGDEVIRAWCKSLGSTNEQRHHALGTMLRKHGAEPGGAHPGNSMQSALWGVVDEFRRWARAQA